MRAYTAKVENSGASADGRLSAEEDSTRFYELAQAVVTAGITPDPYGGPDVDKQQLAQALARYASLGTSGTCTGAANTYVISALGSTVVPKGLFDGMIVVMEPSATNTGASTANVFGLGSKAVRLWSDAALSGGELISGRPTAWRYKSTANGGSGAWLILPWADALNDLITTAITITIGGGGVLDQPTLAAALEWLARRRITTTGSVVIQLPSGQMALAGAVITLSHPDGHKITLQGATLTGGGFPTDANITITGHSSGARATDTAAALVVLRARIPTELQFTGAGQIVVGNWGAISGILVTCSSTPTSDGIKLQGRATLTSVAVVGAGANGINVAEGVATLNGAMGIGCAATGIATSASVKLTGLAAGYSNAGHGISIGPIGSIGSATSPACARGNATAGLYCNSGDAIIDNGTAANCVFSTNGSHGVYAEQSRVETGNVVVSANGAHGVYATIGGLISVGASGSAATITNNARIGLYANGGKIFLNNDYAATISGNIEGSLFSYQDGFIDAYIANLGSGSVQASNRSAIRITSATNAGALSPAANTIGNSNSIIIN